jgi:hypothetical protein
MLSFNKGRPIAIIKNGKYNNKILHIDNDNNEPIKNNPLEILENIYKNKNKSKLTKKDISIIKKSLQNDNDDYPESLYDIINNAKNRSRDISKKEFKIFDNGTVQALPRFNKTERAYICGQTECGKSYWCKNYLKQMLKVHPNKKVILISDVDQDEELDNIKNITRLKLTDELENKKPPKPEAFRNNIVLFDDIDSIQNKKVYDMICNLRDSLLRRGRHEGISVLITSHLCTNYKDTRIILNECNSITFFPRSGSSHGIKYMLKKYAGLNKAQIQKIFNLPSRAVTVYMYYPQYVIYEKGVYLL